jgi:hypothetical protein
MKCPSGEALDELLPSEKKQIRSYIGQDTGLAKGSYKGVAGIRRSGGTRWDYPNHVANSGSENAATRGPLFAVGPAPDLGAVTLAQITDGTTHTLLIGEYSSRAVASQEKYVGTAFWASSHAYHNITPLQEPFETRIPDYDACRLSFSGPICDRAFASFHLGIIQFVRCDGSLATLRSDIDPDIYLAMGTITGGEIVPDLN